MGISKAQLNLSSSYDRDEISWALAKLSLTSAQAELLVLQHVGALVPPALE
jgi:hypothetical protein